MDTLDKAILSALLHDGRLSQTHLAERIPLSSTAIARRIRAMEEAGIIEGYKATVSPKALGLTVMVFVSIRLKAQTEEVLAAFEKAAQAAPSVLTCHLMSGDEDYMLTVLARDLSDYERIHKEELSRLPGVTQLKSSFALREVKSQHLPARLLLP